MEPQLISIVVDADPVPNPSKRIDQYCPGSISLRFFRVLIVESVIKDLYLQRRPARVGGFSPVSEVAVEGLGVSHGTRWVTSSSSEVTMLIEHC